MEIIIGIIVVIGIIGSIIENWDKIVEFFIGLLIVAVVIFIVGAILFAIGDEFGAGGVIITIIGSIVIYYVGIWYRTLYQAWDINHEIKIKEKRLKKDNERKILGTTKERYLKETHINDSIKIYSENKILDLNTLLILIKNGLDINSQDEDGQTALHKLLQANKTKSIRILLEQGARLDIKNKNNKTAMESASTEMKEYFSPFCLIMRNEMELLWKMNHKGMDINFKTVDGQTALHALALKDFTLKDDSNNLKMLIDKGIDINSRDKKGRTPLFYAVINGNEIAVKNLLLYAPLIDTKDKEDKTLFDYIKIYENKELIPLLKKHSKKHKKRSWIIWVFIIVLVSSIVIGFVKFPNPVKNTLLSYYINNGYFETADMLLQYGAITPKVAIVDMVINNENINAIRYQLKNQKTDLNLQDKKGKTVLHYAFEKSNLETIKFLINQGAKLDILDTNMNTPCFYSMYNTNEYAKVYCEKENYEGSGL